jgi:hypothetical protein
MNLPEMGIYFRAECPFPLSQIVATDQAVWALRTGVGSLVVRVGLRHCPMGIDWVEYELVLTFICFKYMIILVLPVQSSL